MLRAKTGGCEKEHRQSQRKKSVPEKSLRRSHRLPRIEDELSERPAAVDVKKLI
jgi:hypothetical protein